jgi:hypothetical protein
MCPGVQSIAAAVAKMSATMGGTQNRNVQVDRDFIKKE